MIVRTSATLPLRAFHTDPFGDEGRHEHVWMIKLVANGEPFLDARALREALRAFLEPLQNSDLPPHLWAAEDIAKHCLLIGTCDPIGCVVTRDGFEVEVWLDQQR